MLERAELLDEWRARHGHQPTWKLRRTYRASGAFLRGVESALRNIEGIMVYER